MKTSTTTSGIATRSHGPADVTVAQLAGFDEIIDVRSESEFADDHIPGAVNCPVLNDAQRADVGTIYKQVSSFDAKKIGAALVSENIARHLRERFQTKPRDWRPLVVCWRGGGRSGAMAHVLTQIGWRTGRLEGGYKAYRRAVILDLEMLPSKFTWRVVCGMTGTGKSRLLRALDSAGAQVLDLEALAAHRGSVLGNLPHASQPPQKMFESRIWHALQNFDASRPVYVESESKKIGTLRVPDALITAMWASETIVLEAAVATRVMLLKEEYAHFLADTATLNTQLECLTSLHGHATIAHWAGMARDNEWDALTEELLARHYDPSYTRAIIKHYPSLDRAVRLQVGAADDATFAALAKNCLEKVSL
ncbi:MAG: tRNA 2-selenouridine(34) synthase MnmH [Burkholderiales bacterium]